MKAWRYYQIGAGLMIPFDSDLSFKPGVKVIQSFDPCKDSLVFSTRNAKRKPGVKVIQSFDPCKDSLVFSTRNAKRKDHQINNRNYPQSFVNLKELEDHMTRGIHQIPTVKSEWIW